ncbi:MAG: DUF1800 domain-containing protein [Planctomycetes bacterium]|nr:DUF1800 domain-containing protein [Planctomycetota bacterium]
MGLAHVALWTLACTADPDWTLAEARHLLDRAGFGATPQEIARIHALGREAAVDALLDPGSFVAFDDPSPPADDPSFLERAFATEEERRAFRRERARDERLRIERYRDFWMREMAQGDDPVREKLALFWHGFFTSSQRDVRDADAMIGQIERFREHGMTSYADLLHAIATDPAMLKYLNNDKNRKQHPNENFAREVLELFSMGPGHYTEADIKEAARAFTGWVAKDGEATFVKARHDRAEKTFLGKTGKFDGADVLDIVLDQDATARFVAAKFVEFYVGPGVDTASIETFARTFRAARYDVRTLLRAIFLSDAFSAPSAQGALFKSPVEFMASTVRRLELDPPPFLALAAEHLGQSLLFPPNVKGWEGGETWFNTASILNRANVARILVHGSVGVREAEAMVDDAMRVAQDDAEDGAANEAKRRNDAFARAVKRLRRWDSKLDPVALCGSARTSNAAIRALCDRFLPVAPYASTVAELQRFIAPHGDDAFDLNDEETRDRVRDAVHLVLSLPEYQLN